MRVNSLMVTVLYVSVTCMGGGKANEFTGTETEVQVLNVTILSLQLIQT